MPALIGLGGRLASGKDTVADYLVATYGYVKIGMSDPLHQALLILNPLIRYSSPTVAPTHLRYADLVAVLGYTHAKTIPEVRRLLQTLGTEVGRSLLGADTWVNVACNSILAHHYQGTRVVITGMRFANELAMVTALGGATWWVERPAFAFAFASAPESKEWEAAQPSTSGAVWAKARPTAQHKQDAAVQHSLSRAREGREALQGMVDSVDKAGEPSNAQVRNNADQRRNNAQQEANNQANRQQSPRYPLAAHETPEEHRRETERQVAALHTREGYCTCEGPGMYARDCGIAEHRRQGQHVHSRITVRNADGTTTDYADSPQSTETKDPASNPPGILGGADGQARAGSSEDTARHASENSVGQQDFAAIVLNTGTIEHLHANVELLLAGRGMEQT